jgi:threonine dehydratase
MDGGSLPTSLDVEHAQARLAGRVRRTPVLALDGSELGVAGRVVLKLEYLQHTGTFKPRGALNALLSRTIPDGGVVAASGGNHGLGVAWAAAHLGVPAIICVPSTSSAVKADRIRDTGAQVTTVTGTYSDALAEPGGAVAQAALTSGTWNPPTTNSVTVVVVCGANTNHLPARPRNGPHR